MLSNKPQTKFHSISSNISMVDAGLDQQIRKSNVRSFVKKGVSTGKENQYLSPQTCAELEFHLLTLKKSCSELVQKVKAKDQQILKVRDETSQSQLKCQQIRSEQDKLEKQMIQLKKNVDKINSKKEEASHCSKTYENILQRMKKDEVLLQFKRNTLQRQLKSLQKIHDLTEAKHYEISEFQQLAKSGLKDAYCQIQQQSRLRNGNFQSIQNETKNKEETKSKLEKKQKQTEQIRLLAADDIQDADLLKLKKFIRVQLFLKQLLKSKMFKLKKHYEPFEEAFFKIKSSTKVRDAVSLKNEFLNYEKQYTEKTVWVKNLEVQISNAEQERKKLKQKLIESQVCQIEETEKSLLADAEDPRISKRQMGERSLHCQLLWERIQVWIATQSAKMNMEYKNVDLVQLFAKISQQLKTKKLIS